MAEPNTEVVTKPRRARNWDKLVAKAKQDLAVNDRAMATGPVPSHETLRQRGFVTSPGDKQPLVRVPQALKQGELSVVPAPAVNKKS